MSSCELCSQSISNPKVCSTCQCTYYCSKDCQKKDLRAHRKICTRLYQDKEFIGELQSKNTDFMNEVMKIAEYYAVKNQVFRWMVHLSDEGNLRAIIPSCSDIFKHREIVPLEEGTIYPKIDVVLLYNKQNYMCIIDEHRINPDAKSDFLDDKELIVVTEIDGKIQVVGRDPSPVSGVSS